MLLYGFYGILKAAQPILSEIRLQISLECEFQLISVVQVFRNVKIGADLFNIIIKAIRIDTYHSLFQFGCPNGRSSTLPTGDRELETGIFGTKQGLNRTRAGAHNFKTRGMLGLKLGMYI